MKKINEERLKKLDKLNLVWLIENISVGKLVRGIYRLREMMEPTIDCLKRNCREQTPPSEKADDKKPQKETPKETVDEAKPVVTEKPKLDIKTEDKK